MRLKVSETPIHSDLSTRFDKLVRNAIESNTKLPNLEKKRGVVTTVGTNDVVGELKPDEGWSVYEDDFHARLVLEVAYSQARHTVAQNCEEYIYGTRSHVRAAIAIKIFYPRSNPDR
ncbi:hypothetical protein ColLi_11431 [Colletotrichum liriopes]|uniref:Uncharacterized protein n=1 Tax=Colletotrichum liriopes TaxID=708192 RepID=A0AA37GWG0_9PEZI|nr:hypothetical protein ColLi_11431 [Colletotrichum liriopes]